MIMSYQSGNMCLEDVRIFQNNKVPMQNNLLILGNVPNMLFRVYMHIYKFSAHNFIGLGVNI